MKTLHISQFKSFLYFFSLSVLFFATSSVAFASEITVDNVIFLTNKDRQDNNLPILQVSDVLTQAAESKVHDMVQKNYFAHTSPEGQAPWNWIEKYGYDYQVAGENLAIRFESAEEQELAWMESTKHRENILNVRYKEIGVAIAKTNRNGHLEIIVVQMFGLRVGDGLAHSENVGDLGDASITTRVSQLANVTIEDTTQPQSIHSASQMFESQDNNHMYTSITIIVLVFLVILGGVLYVAAEHYQKINSMLVEQKQQPLIIRVDNHKKIPIHF